jgi:hypothetical protein
VEEELGVPEEDRQVETFPETHNIELCGRSGGYGPNNQTRWQNGISILDIEQEA